MLENRFFLYRPWIPVCKSIEAGVIGGMNLKEPVLDIGCGNGLFGEYCFNKKIDVGLDYDKNAVREAKTRNIYDKLEVADARNLPFADESFNTIISVCAVEHIPELDKVLESAWRVLKKDGEFIFTVPSVQFGSYLAASRFLAALGLKKKAVSYGDEKNRRSGHLHVYETEKWKELLEDKKFKADKIEHIFPPEAVFLWSFMHSFLVYRTCL